MQKILEPILVTIIFVGSYILNYSCFDTCLSDDVEFNYGKHKKRNESDENQCYGLELAKKVNCFNVFLQPCNKNINKNVWNNCAKILSDKSDEELSPYLPELFRWLKDLNWPGAICIYDRLIISEDELFEYELKVSITTAKAQNDKLWLLALKNLKKERKARDK